MMFLQSQHETYDFFEPSVTIHDVLMHQNIFVRLNSLPRMLPVSTTNLFNLWISNHLEFFINNLVRRLSVT